MDEAGGVRAGQSVPMRRVALASLIGTSLEGYDFIIYGTAAALVFNKLFFPEAAPLIGILLAFATFGAGFVARPLGGLVFGHYGDKVGRKTMLIITLSMMGVATALIGVLPTYGAIGVWAPILLVALRILQGFSAGGEWSGAALMAAEHAPRGKRGLYASWNQAGSPVGLLLATLSFALLTRLPQEQFIAWGWRIPFLVSIVLVAVGLFVRLRIVETPEFARVKERSAEAQMPIVEVLRTNPKNVLLAGGINLGFNAFIFIPASFVVAYATQQLGLPRGEVLNGVLIGGALHLIFIFVFAVLSDRVGRRPVMFSGALFLVLFAFPFFWLINTGSAPLIWLAMAVGFVSAAALFGPMAALFSELFSARVRYSGASISYNLGTVLGGGLSPFIATVLVSLSGGKTWLVALYMAVVLLISAVSVYLIGEVRDRPSQEEPSAARVDRGTTATQ